MNVVEFPKRSAAPVADVPPRRTTPFDIEQLARAIENSCIAGNRLVTARLRVSIAGGCIEDQEGIMDGTTAAFQLRSVLHLLNIRGGLECDRPMRNAICEWLNTLERQNEHSDKN